MRVMPNLLRQTQRQKYHRRSLLAVQNISDFLVAAKCILHMPLFFCPQLENIMKTRRLLPLALILSTTSLANPPTAAVYDIVKRNQAAAIDGQLQESLWAEIPAISGNFHYPWEKIEAPRTIFRAYHDGENLYFSFDVSDKDVVAVKSEDKNEKIVDSEDRVELFFAPAAVDQPNENGIPPYYAIEIDPTSRVHDYSIKYYRHFDSAWTMPQLQTGAHIHDKGYSVEGKIPLAVLGELGVLQNDVMRTGVFRAEFSSQQGKTEPLMQWISWVNPQTAHPDFHVNAAFGQFRFLAE